MSNLIGTNANQVPTCGMLGTLAFMDAANPTVPRVEVTTDTTLDATHSGKLIIMTSATQRAITLPLSSDMPAGWFCYLQNKSTGSDWHYITKSAGDTYAECSDGANTWSGYAFYPEEVRMVMKATAGFKSIVLRSFYVTILSTVSFSRPPGYSALAGMLWGGGGSGGRSGNTSYDGGGGGGGACTPFHILKADFGASQTITIGAGGTARTGVQVGVAGGDSTLGSICGAYGGGGGGIGGATYPTSAYGGGGGGSWSAGVTGGSNLANLPIPCGGLPAQQGSTNYMNDSGFGGAQGTTSSPSSAAYGGGGGSTSGTGGSSVYGGGGGGGSSFGGASAFGGDGGMGGGLSSSGVAGTVPGGGGGGTRNGTTSGAGANGQCIIYGVL